MCGCNRDFVDDRIEFRREFERFDGCGRFGGCFERFEEFDGCHRRRHCGICGIFRRRHHCCERERFFERECCRR